MIALIFFIFCVGAVSGVGLLAAWSDLKGMTIPNLYSLIVAGLFFVCYGVMALAGQGVFLSFGSHLLSGVIVFAVSAAMFHYRIMGAADSKLASAYSLWLGIPGLIPFLFYMALTGGVLGVIALLLKRYKPFKNPDPKSWVGQVQGGASKVPYGVAIVLGVFISFGFLGYFSFNTYISFL